MRLGIVNPATAIGWRRSVSRCSGVAGQEVSRSEDPASPGAHHLHPAISSDHPERGEDRIAEQCAAKLAIHHAASTIRRYMVSHDRTPRGDQTRRTFIRNHSRGVWTCDCLTQHTAFYAVAYVSVFMETSSRWVVHVNVTANPTLSRVRQQIRKATDRGRNPRFLVHDNQGVSGELGTPLKVERDGKTRGHRCHLDW